MHVPLTEVILTHDGSDLLPVFQKVCDALAFTHSRHLIHRASSDSLNLAGRSRQVVRDENFYLDGC